MKVCSVFFVLFMNSSFVTSLRPLIHMSAPKHINNGPCRGMRPFLSKLGATCLLSTSLALGVLTTPTDFAIAADSARVGSIPASGLIFKDTLDVTAFDDPKVQGVTLYVSDFSKPITERLQGDFFSDPSTASITCAATGPVKLGSNVDKSMKGEEVFEEKKNLLFKSVKVRRIVDNENKNLVYVSYSQKLVSNGDTSKSRFKSSLCAVHFDDSS